MASLANIQAYDTSPILQQQAQDAMLFSKQQSDFADYAAKMAQLQYQQNKDAYNKAQDVTDGFNKLVLSKNFAPSVTKAVLGIGIEKIKPLLSKGDYIGASNIAAEVVADATERNDVINRATEEAGALSKGLGDYGVNPDVFKSEYLKRRLFKTDGTWKSPEEILSDQNDYTAEVLENANVEGLFKPDIKPLSRDYGKVKSKIDVSRDSGIVTNRSALELEHPSYLKYDKVSGKFIIPNDILQEMFTAEVLGDNVKRAVYSRRARAEGARTPEDIEKMSLDMFKDDVLRSASTSVSSTQGQNYDNTAARMMMGLTNALSRGSKYAAPSPIEAIAGAMSYSKDYIGSMNFVSRVRGYDNPLIDVTAQMPDKGLVVGRKDGKLITADKVYVDPQSKALVVFEKGEKTPKVYKGLQFRNMLGQLPGFNNIREGEDQVNNLFDPKGMLRVGDDAEGKNVVSEQFSISKSADIQKAHDAIDIFAMDQKLKPLNESIRGLPFSYRVAGTGEVKKRKIKSITPGGVFGPKYEIEFEDGGKKLSFPDAKSLEEFTKQIKLGLR